MGRVVKTAFRLLFGTVVLLWLLGSCANFVTSNLPPSASPTPSVSESPPARLLPAVHAKRNRNYTFMADMSGASWDPCLPINYVVNPANQPPGGLKAVQSAIATVSRATGLTFVYAGKTREKYSSSRADYQPSRYPNQWAPVLISWEGDKQFNRDLRSGGEKGKVSAVVGWGGPEAITLAHSEFEVPESYIITGTVTLRVSYMSQLLRNGGGAEARAVIIHELGHVMGLDHVKSKSQIMNAASTVTSLGAGDRYGFAVAGSGKCAVLSRRPIPHAIQ